MVAGVGAGGNPSVARRSPQSILKRQREQKRAEKARAKLAKREARKAGDGLVLDDDPGELNARHSSDVESAGETDERDAVE